VLYTIQPSNPINNKKKELSLVSPARPRRNRSILLLKQEYPPIHRAPTPFHSLFLFSFIPNCRLRLHFILNPLDFAPTSSSYSLRSHLRGPTSLAISLFLFLATLNQLGWRLRQLAALKHLNKPCCCFSCSLVALAFLFLAALNQLAPLRQLNKHRPRSFLALGTLLLIVGSLCSTV
jgi:hypothetical protein